MTMTHPEYWNEATRALSERDPVMRALIAAYPSSVMSSRGQPFYTLVRSVVGQQISVKAADSIWARFEALVGEVSPKRVLAYNIPALRSVGLSERKAQYVHAVAVFFESNRVGANYWDERSDAHIIAELTSIRGIGRWTAEMFLMFTLLRPNVFPVDDIGLLRGLEKAYHGERVTPSVAKTQYFERFSPWASVATWYLWRSLDPIEVSY